MTSPLTAAGRGAVVNRSLAVAAPLDDVRCGGTFIRFGGPVGYRIEMEKAAFLRFDGAVERDPAIRAWMDEHAGELGLIAQQWFAVMRACGDEVRELLHDGCPVVCFGDAPFAYVNAFAAHVNVGFFHGAALPDPARILQGTGRFMRHVKIRPGKAVNAGALSRLIEAAYWDIRARVEKGR